MPKVFQRDQAQAIMTGRRCRVDAGTWRLDCFACGQRPDPTEHPRDFCAGRRIPSDLLINIARKLETTVAYLLAISDDPGPAPVAG